jgi:hypothetical protein
MLSHHSHPITTKFVEQFLLNFLQIVGKIRSLLPYQPVYSQVMTKQLAQVRVAAILKISLSLEKL